MQKNSSELQPPNRPLFHARIEVARHVTKKNKHTILRAGSKSWIGKTSETRLAEHAMLIQLMKAKAINRLTEPINIPIHIIFKFYFSNFFSKPRLKTDPPKMSLTLGDLSNLYQMPEDCLQKAEIIANDALIMSHDGSRKLPSTNGRDYLEITILPFKE